MPYTRQTNFSGGELSPLLWGRTDLPLFAVGLRQAKNFFISRQGMAVSRPGTTFIRKAKSTVARLIPFVQSDSVSYVLVMDANGTCYVISNGADTGSTFAHPYTASQLRDVRYAQVGDVMTLTHPSHAPRELRLQAGTWTLSTVDFTLVPTRFVDTLTPNQAVSTSNFRLVQEGTGYLVDSGAAKLREWRYMVSAVVREVGTMRTFETRAQLVTEYLANSSLITSSGPGGSLYTLPADGRLALSSSHPLTLRRSYASDATYAGQYVVLGYNIFRGRGGLYGFVGSTVSFDFTDVGDEPDYRLQPPRGKDPFTYVESLPPYGSAVNDWPGAVSFFEERRVFAGSGTRPGFLFFSASGSYRDFDDESLLPVATQALTYELAARRREKVRDLVHLRRLLAFTGASVWSVGGSGGEPLSPETLPLVQVEDEVGAAGPSPLVVDGMALYVRAKGRGVRALVADDTGGFSPRDVSFHADHLFRGESQLLAGSTGARTIVEWAYQEDPWGVVWAVRDDGVLLSLTPMRDTGAFAWAQQESFGEQRVLVGDEPTAVTKATFTSVCVVPEGNEDGVYVLVRRNTNEPLYLERFNSRVAGVGPEVLAAVDSAKTYTNAGAYVEGDLPAYAPHLAGWDVYITGPDVEPMGPVTVGPTGTVTLPRRVDANYTDPLTGVTSVLLYVGLPYQCDLELLDVVTTDSRAKQKTVVQVGFEVDNAVGLHLGQDADHLVEWRQRRVADSYGAIGAATELVVVPVNGKWDRAARAFLRQTLPAPVTVTGILREVDVGG